MRRWPHAVLWVALAGCDSGAEVAAMPVADAGFDQIVLPATEATLDGSGSFDPDGRDLSYRWTLVSKPAASSETLTAASTVSPRLLLDVDGYYVVSLVVSNGERESLPDVVSLLASSTTNFPPLADARCAAPTAGCATSHGAEGRVHGNQSSDPNGDPLTSFQWSQVLPGECASKCPGMAGCAPIPELVSWTQSNDTLGIFTAPADGIGFLVLQLAVSDGALTGTDCIAFESTNTQPFAIISPAPPASRAEGQVFALQGTPDSDSDAADWPNLVYEWTHEPAGVFVNYDPSPAANPVNVDVRGLTAGTTVTFTLTVSDPWESSNPCGTDPAFCGGRTWCGSVSVLITGVAINDGQTCSFDSQCASGNCECTNANCTGLRCRANPCFCEFDAGGGCDGTDFLNDGVTDPEDCDTGGMTCQAGVCQ
ncbi:MAG: hypothetical protein HYZ27_10795 [Deltaproteobacteria bacterium]|nr:hypothetical protein [Deltaproteobacteria bacterium]